MRARVGSGTGAVAVLLLLMAAACGGGAEPPEVTLPPQTGVPPDIVVPPDTIVAGFSDFNSEIYTVAPDGGDLTRITDTPEYVELDPVWAPDGRLAFVHWRFFESQDELIVTRADGREPVRVAGGMDISQPAWSPDGSRIAFLEGRASFYTVQDVSECTRIDSSRGQTPPRLFVADVASRTAVPLIDLVSPDGCVLPFARPQWSPDGTKIALGRRGVYLVNVASGRLTEIVPPSDIADAAWSPDGQRLAVAVAPSYGGPSARILVAGADGRGLTEIARQIEGVHSLAWSPQGNLISFVAGNAYSGQGSLFVINPDGSGLRSLVQGVLEETVWSPDGRRLAAALADPSSSASNPNIYTVDVDDGGITRLTNADATEYSPVWSPDGSAIAFISHRDSQGGIFAVHPDGSLTPLIPTHGEPPEAFLGPDRRLLSRAEVWVDTRDGRKVPLTGAGALSPDASRLAASVPVGTMESEGCGGDEDDIYVWNVDGSQVTNVTNTPDVNEIEVAWSPDGLLLALTSGVPPRCHLDPARLEVMKADGSERRLLADFEPSRGQVQHPEWVAGGSALLFSVRYPAHGALPGLPAAEEGAELYTVNVDGSGLTRLLESPGARIELLLSPDRTRLAVVEIRTAGGWTLLLGGAGGADLQEVVRGQEQPSSFQWWPTSWSPDSIRLAFTACEGDPCQSALFVVNADGSDLRRLADSIIFYETPAWSPDGSRLAEISHPHGCDIGEGVPPGYLEVVDVDSGAHQRLTDRCVVRSILGWTP